MDKQQPSQGSLRIFSRDFMTDFEVFMQALELKLLVAMEEVEISHLMETAFNGNLILPMHTMGLMTFQPLSRRSKGFIKTLKVMLCH